MRRRRKEKNNANIIMAIIIGFVMISSIAGFISFGGHGGGGGSSQTVRYNGLRFTLVNAGWRTSYEGQTYTFSATPNDVEYLSLPQGLNLENLVQVDITSNINDTYREAIAGSVFELTETLSKRNVFVRRGFTEENDFLPVITCDDATPSVPVIFFEESDEIGIFYENNCIIIRSADPFSFIAQTNRLAYGVLGII